MVNGGDELDHDVMANHLLSDEVVIYLNMLGSSMEYRIRSKGNGRKGCRTIREEDREEKPQNL